MGDIVDIDDGAVDAFDRQIGNRGDIIDGASFSWIVYSYVPIFSVPTGVIRFCAANAFATS